MPEPTRAEHLQWCKDRAIRELNAGGPSQGFASMLSDLRKHSGTADHPGIVLGSKLFLGGHLNYPEKMREWILGHN